MAITNALASLAVADLSAAAKWYEKLFGRAADSTPMPEVAEWKFERGGWLQVYELKARAGAGSVTLAVSDLDEQIKSLHQLGIDTDPPLVSSQASVVMIKDPDGNSLAFAQARDPKIAQ
jgi:predicted enzyme related to lactoylglutathione lyase